MKRTKLYNFYRFLLDGMPINYHFPNIWNIAIACLGFAFAFYVALLTIEHSSISEDAGNMLLGVLAFLLPCLFYVIKRVFDLKLSIYYDYYLYGSSIWALIFIYFARDEYRYISRYRTELLTTEYYLYTICYLLMAFTLVVTAVIYFWESIKTERYKPIEQTINYSTFGLPNDDGDISAEDKRREAGEKGEKDVAFQLRYLPKEYRVINNIEIRSNGLKAQIDHLIVGPTGIYHIETKNYAGNINIDRHGQWLRKKRYSALELLDNPTGQLERHHETILNFLKQRQMGNWEDYVYPACVSANKYAIIEGHENFPFPLWRADNIVNKIKNRPSVLSKQQIEKLYATFKSYKANNSTHPTGIYNNS